MTLRRREFIALLGGAAAWPLAVRAQQGIPVIGYLDAGSSGRMTRSLTPLPKGLNETGYFEGRNVAIEYRWADNQIDRLPELAADLVRRRVAVICTAGPSSALAAKTATTSIPIVFVMGSDPVQRGVVATLNRPGGNITGVVLIRAQAIGKRVGLLHEVVPGAARFAVLVDPRTTYDPDIADARAAASAVGAEIEVVTAVTSGEIDAAFATLLQRRADGLLINGSVLFGERRVQIVTLAARHAVPAIYFDRDFPEVGGLMSYGSNLANQVRQAGVYLGRILKGEKPGDLPVIQPTRFEFIINLQTAKTLGLTIPAGIRAIADEVIE
jgi:ABC-type uncharacterized transport system substrate-binding protein